MHPIVSRCAIALTVSLAGCTGANVGSQDFTVSKAPRDAASPAAQVAPEAAQTVTLEVPPEFAGDSRLTMAFTFPEPSGYAVTATASDIARIDVVLSAGDVVVQRATVERAQLVGRTASVSFTNLKAGAYTVALVAVDATGLSIGTGTAKADVATGTTTNLNAKLQLAAPPAGASPEPAKGGVAVTIDILAPTPSTPMPTPSLPGFLTSPLPTRPPSATPSPSPAPSATPRAGAWTPDQLPKGFIAPPVGAGYIRYTDIPGYSATDSLQANLNKLTTKAIVTFPEGTFEFPAFAAVNAEGLRLGGTDARGARNVLGIIGSGRGTIFKPIKMSSTKASLVPAQVPGGTATNPCVLMRFDSIPNVVVKNFSVVGTPQGHDYNGISFVGCHGGVAEGLYLRGASPGSANSPPGETFGLSPYKSNNFTIRDSEVDGRDPETGARIGASPIGWNGQGPVATPTYATGAVVERCYVHDGKAGMPTFWITKGITVTDLWSHRTASGNGGLAGSGINLECSQGPIRIVRPNLVIAYHQPTENSSAGNSGLHISLYHAFEDVTDVQIIEPTFDTGFSSTGAFCLASYAGYNINGNTNKVGKAGIWPTIIKNGVTLKPYPNGTSGWGNGLTAASGYAIAR